MDSAQTTPAAPKGGLRRKTKKRRRWLVVVPALALALGLTVAWMKLRPRQVEVVEITTGTAAEAVYATGTIEALDRVLVKSKVAGTVVDILVKDGALVRKGDLLARIDAPSQLAELSRGRAELAAASAQAAPSSPQLGTLYAQSRALTAELVSARADLLRFEQLRDAGTVAEADSERLLARVRVLEAQLLANQAQQASARIELRARKDGASALVDGMAARLADAEVRAPVDGVVLAHAIELGELVTLGQPLFKIGSSDNLVLECSIDEADIARVSKGQAAAVSLYAFPGQVVRGEVFEIAPDADRGKKTFLTKIRLIDSPRELRSGMSAEVNVILGERTNVTLAPADGVDLAGVAWVVVGYKVERRPVRVGIRDGMRLEVLEGLRSGERVVVGGSPVTEGQRVRPIPRATPPSAVKRSGATL